MYNSLAATAAITRDRELGHQSRCPERLAAEELRLARRGRLRRWLR
jgi:hypothetical protein